MKDSLRPLRRVVTGLDAGGRSTVIFDEPSAQVIWTSTRSPADNSGSADAWGTPFTFDIPRGGSTFFYTDFPPAGQGPSIGMHATNSLDYAVVITGELVLLTQSGETKLGAGDVVVDRGVLHAWRNDSSEPCRVLFVFVPALPINGRT